MTLNENVPNIISIIPARGGSKGIPRKNIRNLAGKPLISYTINVAKNSQYNLNVLVTTDDDEIKHISEQFSAKTVLRDKMLAEDKVTLDPVIFDALIQYEEQLDIIFDIIITMQPTSPLLNPKSLDAAVNRLISDPTIDTIISAKYDTHLTWRKVDDKFIPNYKKRMNRQELEPIYKETGGFLISRRSCVSKKSRIGDNVTLHLLNDKESIDIDTFEDWNICEYHIKKKTILFVVAGNSEIGLGHVYNTLIVAGDILEHDVRFLVTRNSKMAMEKLSANNYLVDIQKSDDIFDDILNISPDLVINDILDTDIYYIDKIKDAGISVMNFEDLGQGASKADIVINAIYPEIEVLPNHYYGPSYFCARDEFLHYPEKSVNDKVENVLITFGGVDPLNLTAKTIKCIAAYCADNCIEINVVTGFGYEETYVLEDLQGISYHKDVKNISKYMFSADIVFTSAGRTIYELAVLGTPTIVMAQNQREMTHLFASGENGFLNLGLGSEVSDKKLLSRFISICENLQSRVQMNHLMLQKKLITGRSKVNKLIRSLI